MKYGRVKYFLTCPAGSANSLDIAVIDELQIERCKDLLQLSYPREIQCLSSILTTDFVYVTNEGSRVAVPIEHVVLKCCEIRMNDSILITTLVGQSEVAQ